MNKLTLLSWNIAQAQPSNSAPKDWKEEDSTETRQSIANQIRSNNPDILALQEVPSSDWLPMIVSFERYIPIGSVHTHCGCTSLLIRPQLAQNIKHVFKVGPSIIAMLHRGTNIISVSSSHLSPGRELYSERREQFSALIRCAKNQQATHMIFSGDLNLRSSEDQNIESLTKPPLIDIWKRIGDSRNQWTWNSALNHYHAEILPMKARYDRIYCTHNISPESLRRVGAKPLTNPHHFPSDHFGLIAKMLFI